jgi:hypothetical protein
LSGRRQGAGLVADVLDQLVPRCHERIGALLLEAPSLASRRQRSESSMSRYAL